MPLESATYINQLLVTNPEATDALSQADEHLRLIKSTLQATFPNITGPVTKTQVELDAAAATSAIISDGSAPTLTAGITAASLKTLLAVTEPAIVTDGSTPTLATGITAAAITTLLGITALAAYPVGAVYTSVVSTTPDTLFGGTWLPIGVGKVLVGIDSLDTDFDTVEASGGSKTHILNVSEMPAHSHDVLYQELDNLGQTTHPAGTNPGDPTATIATQSTGGGGAHNNLQPYLVVHMWKRVV
tara:strand:+ start:2060 stop:2791 length:732 start_codon:yes stop_codon:yes gene_type:complete